MENVKYIPGDLVIDPFQNGKVSVVVSTSYNSDGCFTKALGTNNNALSTFSSLSGIPLTPQILEANGWKLMQQGIDDEGFEYGKYFKDYSFSTLIFYPHIGGQTQNMSALINGKDIKSNLLYCHQLQHLLFGLGLNSELKV